MNSENIYENLTCPITRQIFLKPVITNTGFTYEKEAICKWIEKSKKCPQSKLKITNIFESFLIKNLVEAYLNANPDKKIDQYKESGEEYKNPFVVEPVSQNIEQDNRNLLSVIELLITEKNENLNFFYFSIILFFFLILLIIIIK